jgi:glycosyltransferase involved in cell wall biosynthesis
VPSPPSNRRPRCLFLSPRAPWPLDDGGRVVLWQGLLALAGRFETHLVVMRRASEPAGGEPAALREQGIVVSYVEHRPPAETSALVEGLVGRWPYTLARFHSHVFARGLAAVVSRFAPDLAYINHLHLATYAPVLGGCVSVLREHNLEQLFLERFARSAKNPAVAAYGAFQAHRMRAAEAELCREQDLVLAMHEEEAAAIRAFAPGVRVEAVPAGATFVDLARRTPAAEPTLVVVGSFDREANAVGLERFLEQGWPIVHAGLPGARLRIIGRHLAPRLAERARVLGAEPAGFVQNLSDELARAWAMVIPLWYGAGLRVKTVEAMGAGVPVACTPLGVEGLGLVAGRHHVEGADAAALGHAALGLLREPARAAALAAAAHAALRATHSLEAVAARTVELCEASLAARTAGPA